MKNANNFKFGLALVVGVTFSLVAGAVAAQGLPDDNWYVGGPDGEEPAKFFSETWHFPDEAAGDLHIHKQTEKKRITILREGGVNGEYKLIPEPSLGWPLTIELVNHPAYNDLGSAAQWRWIGVETVEMENELGVEHDHHVCVGYPVVEAALEKHNETICIGIFDTDPPPRDPKQICGKCPDAHPGHLTADR